MKISVKTIAIIIVALIAATILWLHVLTERTYEIEMEFALKVIDLPQRYVLADEIPAYAHAIIRGRGKDLLAQIIAGNEAVISAKHFSYGNKKVVLGEDNFKLVCIGLKIEQIISPQEVLIRLDRKAKKDVPVVSNLTIIPAAGLITRRVPEFKPATVSIEGPESKIIAISKVYTMADTLRDFNTGTSVAIPLAAPASNVRPVPDTVTAMIEVEPIAQRRIENVAIELTNMPARKGKLEPDHIAVIITGAESHVGKVEINQVRAFVSYDDITKKGTELVKPTVIVPDKVQVLSTAPEYVRFIPRKKTNR